MAKELTGKQREEALDDLKRLNGLPPHDTPANICWGDGYFAKSIERKYGMSINKLELEVGLTQPAPAPVPAKQEANKSTAQQVQGLKSTRLQSKEATTVAVVEQTAVPAEIQLKVDEHLDLYAQYKEIEKKLDVTKAVIKQYMDITGTSEIEGTHGGKVTNKPVNNAVMNAEYTSYDPEEIAPFIAHLKPAQRREILVTRVAKSALEAHVALQHVPEEVLLCKVVNPQYQFRTYPGKK